MTKPHCLDSWQPCRRARRHAFVSKIAWWSIFYLVARRLLSTGDTIQAASKAAVTFYETPGTVTAALRSAAASINQFLHGRNQSRPAATQYTVGLVALVAIRESQLTVLMSGPMQAYVIGTRGVQHVSDPLSGRGLGLSETLPHHFSQLNLQANDRVILCPKPPLSWDSALKDASETSLEATHRRLMTAAPADVSAVLMQATEGAGALAVRRPSIDERILAQPASSSAEAVVPAWGAAGQERASLDESRGSVPDDGVPDSGLEAHSVGLGGLGGSVEEDLNVGTPSAYAIAPEPAAEQLVEGELTLPPDAPPDDLPRQRGAALDRATRRGAGQPSARSRQAARTVIGAVKVSRQASEKLGQGLGRFLPRLLPVSGEISSSFLSPAMMFIAVLVPLVVVTVASAVYFRYGRSVQYEQNLVQAQDARAQAASLTDPSAEREAWQRELFYLDQAESYNQTAETAQFRVEAQQALDKLLGIARLQFQPVLSSALGVRIARLAATDTALYLLDAERGSVLHVALSSEGFKLDNSFNCAPGTYGDYSVGPLIDLAALPEVNSLNATVVGVDAAGTLLYCAPGQVAQAAPLPPPDTNWGRVKAFTFDSGNLYALDAQARAVWVYAGKDSSFVDRPYFFFGAQIPELEDAIDLAVTADDLFVLHSDGRVSTCSYSRNEAVPTRCMDPATLVNPFPAYRDLNIFSEAHFTQMMFTPAPDSGLELLDADGQGVFRFAPGSLELQSQLRAVPGRGNPLPQGQVTAMAMSPSHVLYFVVLGDRLYFAPDAP